MNEEERQKINQLRAHLYKLHSEWDVRVRSGEDDGYCSPNEGYVGIIYRYPNWFEARGDYLNAKPELAQVEVYSYLFGPHRLHTFSTVDEALKEVLTW